MRQSSRAGILGATTAVFGYAAHRALAEPTINRIQISIDNLPAELEGLTIGQISDVHVGQLQNEDTYLKKIVAAVNSLNVDIMAITGDVVDGSVARLKNSVAPLAQIQSKLGTFYVTGNHEYYSGAVGWIEHFKTFGWHVLGNEHATLNVRGHAIVVAGVHDLKAEQRIPAHACNPEKAFKNSPENAQLTLLLAHHPGTSELTKNLKVDLQLSGHTHAGQYFPATWLVQYFHKFSRGLNRNQNGWVYVNSGTGYWGPPLRTTDISGEITHITLMRA
ncbi:metallophosphoesterase [Hydromonas duriensis]|uniref:metallophosphoesterase n=1 Tax=Hydromonas duriensis TaxID=1527608 RepID=UPI0013C35E9B|nr:metallophosphoesterase [Hydromonas duriensis]